MYTIYMQTFQEVIEKFTGSTNIGLYMIHLERATERVPIINELQEKLRTTLPIFPAVDGKELVQTGHPTVCQRRPNMHRSPGDIGCTVSHIQICRDALLKKYDYIVIFEDDCIFRKTIPVLEESLSKFPSATYWDLFLLGSNNIQCENVKGDFCKILDFNCTHACILKPTFMKALIEKYMEYYEKNTTLSIDTIYSDILKSKQCIGYGLSQCNTFFIQKRGIFSYIIDDIRPY
jgi:hypothetical protein